MIQHRDVLARPEMANVVASVAVCTPRLAMGTSYSHRASWSRINIVVSYIHTVRKSFIYKKKQNTTKRKKETECVCAGNKKRRLLLLEIRYETNQRSPTTTAIAEYEHRKKGSRPDYKFREILDRNHESEEGQVLVKERGTNAKIGHAAF